MVGVYVHRLEECIEACGSYNGHSGTHTDSLCGAVVYATWMGLDTGNCWLKADGASIKKGPRIATSFAILKDGSITVT